MAASLEWGIGPTGALVFASSMVGVDPRDRPRVTCPECDDVVTFKAGERGIVTPHVAHRSGSACAATNPETAEHMNAKLQLARALGQRGTLRLRVRCDFGHAVEADWCAPAWQRAVPEFMLPDVGAAGRRPDVVLFGEGDAVVGAVEVLHTHRVDRAKAADLAAGGVPWVEVRAADVLAWDGDAALPVEASDRETRRALTRTCRHCAPSRAPLPTPEESAAIDAKVRRIVADIAEKKRVQEAAARAASEAARREVDTAWAIQVSIRRRAQAGQLPRLRVVFSQLKSGDTLIVAARCLIDGASMNVAVVKCESSAGTEECWWSALRHVVGLVESRAKRPATLLASMPRVAAANLPLPSAEADAPLAPLKRLVIEAVARTGCVVIGAAHDKVVEDEISAAWMACVEGLKQLKRSRENAGNEVQ